MFAYSNAFLDSGSSKVASSFFLLPSSFFLLGYGDLCNYKWGMILAPGFESS